MFCILIKPVFFSENLHKTIVKMPKFHIDEVLPKGDSYPMIVNFQNGYMTDNFKIKDCTLFENEQTDKSLAAEINGLIYAGDERTENLGKTLILARDRKTGKVRIIEVGCAELKPILKIENKQQHLLHTSNLELSRKFGSKKHKQIMEHKEKLKSNIDTVTEQMQSVTENISEEKLDLSVYDKNDSDDFYIPPINRTADTVNDVYDISKILTDNQFETIYSEIENKDYNADLVPFVKDIITGQKLSQKFTVLAVYASALLKIYPIQAKEVLKKSYAPYPNSPTLNQIIISNFAATTNGRRHRPTPYKDKALCYAIVLIMLINNYKIDIDGLCKDIKITPKTAALKLRVTGASIVTLGNKKVAQLKLPLNTKVAFRRRSAKF